MAIDNDRGFLDVVFSRRSVRKYKPDKVDRSVLERIVGVGLEAPTGCNAHLKEYIIIDDPAVLEQLRPVSGAMEGAPAIIAQLIHPRATRFGEYYMQDAAASVQSMLLAAVALGYASCWVEGPIRPRQEQLRQLLGVPADVDVSALLPVGLPDESPARPPKPELAEVTHYNRFGGT